MRDSENDIEKEKVKMHCATEEKRNHDAFPKQKNVCHASIFYL